MLRDWEALPDFMRVEEVRPYWELLNKKRCQLFLKRCFDLLAATVLSVFLALPMAIIAILIKCDSEGPVFYRQERVTSYGKRFMIHKFRTMVSNADTLGSPVTVMEDARITGIGSKLRRYRLDELPQLFDVLSGNMSFVGTRPEIVRYVEKYQPEFFATLLLPAGITSEASVRYKNEADLLRAVDDVDTVYIDTILPAKMKWNLEELAHFQLWKEFLTMLRTVLAVLGKDNN